MQRTPLLIARVLQWAGVGLLVVVPFLTPTPLQAQATSPFGFTEELWVIQGVQIPAVSDTFAILQMNTFPIRELGFVARYQTPLTRRVSLDLYVYPVPESLSNLTEVETAKVEFQKALDELRRFTATNREGVEVTVEAEQELSIDVGDGLTRVGWLAEGSFHREQGTQSTLVYVFSWDGLFVKARITHDPEEKELVRPRLDAWLRHNLQRIRKVT